LISPDTALAACRFVHDASLLFLWGATAFLIFLVPSALGERVWEVFGRLPVAAICLVLLTTVLVLPIEVAMIADGWGGALDPGGIHDVLFETTVGQAWLAQLAAGLALAVALLPLARRKAIIALGSALGLVALTLSGHASMREGAPGLVQRINDGAHLLAAGGWLGALVALVPLLRLTGVDEWQLPAQSALRRFSTVGHYVVAIVVASGVVNTMLVLSHLPTDWSSTYQMLLAIKIALVAAMAAIAVFNRYVLVPWMARRRLVALAALRLSCMIEIALGIGVVALVAAFGLLDPI
jgi:copper resistance protein D